MIKKLTAYAILLSMVLHCGFKLGVLDHLYQQRHDIALALGLISEKPIALCGSDYSPGNNLRVETHDSSPSVPHTVIQVKDINLFFVPRSCLEDLYPQACSNITFATHPDLYELTLQKSVFHPPCKLS